jgi:hypothetical protein
MGDKPHSRCVSPVSSDNDSFGTCRQRTRERESLVVFSCRYRLDELQKSSRLDLLIPYPRWRFLIATIRMEDSWMLCVVRHL